MNKKTAFLASSALVLVVVGTVVLANYEIQPFADIVHPQRVWTDSPKRQGSLELVSLTSYPMEQRADGKLERIPSELKDAAAYLFFREHGLPRDNSTSVSRSFFLVGKDGRELCLAGGQSRSSQFLWGMTIPDGYGPNAVGASIVARDNGKEIGRWRIKGLPKPHYQFREYETDLEDATLAGLKLSLCPERKVYPWSNQVVSSLKIDGPRNKGERYLLKVRLGRRDWSPATVFDCETEVTSEGSFGGYVCGNGLDDVSRVEELVHVERFKSYVETVRLAGFRLQRRDGQSMEDSPTEHRWELIKPDRELDFVTPSGVHLRVLGASRVTDLNNKALPGPMLEYDISFEAEPIGETMWLARSPLCKSTEKPVSVRYYFNKSNDIAIKSGMVAPQNGKGLQLFYCKLLIPKSKCKEGPIPPVTLNVEQRAVLEEGDAKLLAHVKPEAPPKR